MFTPTPEPPIMVEIRSLRGNFVFFLVLIGLLLGYYFVLRPYLSQPLGKQHPGVGKQLTYVSLEPIDAPAGKALELTDLQGKVVLMNYWATWCGPCVHEFPALLKIQEKFADNDNFQFVSISCPGGRESRDELALSTAEFLEARQAKLPVYFDPQQATFNMVTNSTGAQNAIPTTLVLDGTGTIRGFWQGYSPGVETEIENLIAELLAAAGK